MSMNPFSFFAQLCLAATEAHNEQPDLFLQVGTPFDGRGAAQFAPCLANVFIYVSVLVLSWLLAGRLQLASFLFAPVKHVVVTWPIRHGFEVERLRMSAFRKPNLYSLLAGNAMSVCVVGSVLQAVTWRL